jgi:hypothetical protein
MANNTFQIKRTTVSGRTANVTSPANTQYIATGELAINLPDKTLYSSDGTSLIQIASGIGTGAGSDTVFFVSGQTVNTNYTTLATKNYLSAGPITVNSGITVTITTGSRWVVV